ncbi:MAG: DUF1731 domain-containing protein, partial [Planctomycetes bacterium]|nr:DUF1731 domain-containing protein [Planctomycetota bacterium]
GGRLGRGDQWMSWIHLDDLIRAALFIGSGDHLESGPWNGVAPHPVTNAEFTQGLARAVHRPAWFAVPRFGLRIALGEMAEFLVASTRLEPKALREAGFEFEHPRLAEALDDLLAGERRPTSRTSRA